jgi:putative pyoverdin transport system ATP-binding/permease protein
LPLIGRIGVLRYAFLGLFTGLSSFLFINTVTRVISIIIAGNFTVISGEYIAIFLSIILVYIWSRRMLALTSVNLSMRIGWNLRKKILSLALNASYQQLSSRKTKIQTAILNDVGSLTNASLSIIDFSISVIMTIACFIYLASISIILFAITFGVAIFGVTIYYSTSRRNMLGLEKTRMLENKFQANFNAILNGFKEIFMEPRKGRYIYDHKICLNADDSYRHNLTAITGLINNQITGQVLFYILIASVLLIFSITLKIKPEDIVSFVFTLMYLLGSITSIMSILPTLMQAKVASNHLADLKKDLEDANFKNPVPARYVFKSIFGKISVRGLQFHYGDEETFAIGPINMDIRKGEVIFIYGGNGSGKTTFINSVLGLCFPSAGEIKLNDTLINDQNYPDYRSIFAVVFSDFYLFNEILSESHFDIERWNFWIKLFELEGKVMIEHKQFSTTDLSTGQRKRLALIIALLEEKPILVLDEWAADQDPYFRKKFYTEIVPFLNQEGITIIAITHDDKYYHCADKLYKMEEGKLIEENVNLHQPGYIPQQTSMAIK